MRLLRDLELVRLLLDRLLCIQHLLRQPHLIGLLLEKAQSFPQLGLRLKCYLLYFSLRNLIQAAIFENFIVALPTLLRIVQLRLADQIEDELA